MSRPSALFLSRRLQAMAAAMLCLALVRLVHPPAPAGSAPAEVRGLLHR